jgi:transcription termination/antitermination protein NusA
MKNEFLMAFNDVLEDKQLPKEVILQAIESAMVSAYRRAVNASTAQQVDAKIDPSTGQVTIYAEKEVVEDIVDERTEVLFEEARKVNPLAELGDMVIVETTPRDFGRVAAQTARQVIQQRIREAERNAQMSHFERQLGEIVSGVVQAVSNQAITIGLDMKAEGVMPANQKIPGERFRVHDRIRAIIADVKDGPRGPQIVLSRGHRNFLRRLLETEVPEIYHGIVEIRAISREPGQRAKVAVSATQAGVDPVGACVGVKGVRIQAIVKELHDEKIDIIEWSPDPVIYIQKAISPARISGVYLNEEAKTATVVVMEDQLSLAIGRDGQNARLAAKLTNWRIDIKSVLEAAADTLQRAQVEPDMQHIAAQESEKMVLIAEILQKKADDRPLSPEEYSQLAQFVERVERRVADEQKAAEQADQEQVTALRAEIGEAAFEASLDALGLPEHVFNILTEADYLSAGDLILAMKANPDKVLGLPGIGTKAAQAIDKAVSEAKFEAPVEEPEVEDAESETVESEAEVESPVEEVAATEDPVSEEQPVAESTEAEAVVGEAVAEKAKPESQQEDDETMSFEEMFKLRADAIQPVEEPAEEEDDADKKSKKSKKGKKSVVLEFDEDLGEVVGRKKHKRGDDWDEDSW